MKITALLTFAAISLTSAFGQSHGHINAGATDSNGSGGIDAGDHLLMYFESGTQLTDLAFNSGGNVYGSDGFLWSGYKTFTALHQSSDPNQAPNYNSLGASSGSYLTLELASLSGPEGAKFAFYDAGASDPTWIYQIGTGFLSGNGSIDLTEQSWFEGSPLDNIPSDPFGHIHGRMFAVDLAGDFTATWTLKDTRTEITGLLDSELFTSSFSAAAIPEPATWLLLGGAAGMLFLRRVFKPSAGKRASRSATR